MTNYLIHFNKNHDHRNGQFTFGDGDGDGQREYQARLKKLNKMSDKKLYKTFRKEVRDKRADLHGSYNRWMRGYMIGENSKKLQEENNKKRAEYQKTPEYKAWIAKVNRMNRMAEYDQIKDYDKFDRDWENLMDAQPKKNFNDIEEWVYISGKGYADNFVNRGGKDLSIAYLKDLGYNEKDAKYFVNRLAKSNYTIGGV